MNATIGPSRSSHEVLVTAQGELDLATAGRISEALTRACAQARPVVVLDLTSVEFIDCATLRPVLAARALMHRRGGDLVVRGASPRCRRLLALTGLTELLEDRSDPSHEDDC